jgi:16S rRNA (uracil1498-N3)-methyltransferase
VWAEELAEPGGRVTLADDESRYLARVCRAREGETVSLTDGRGGRAEGRIENLRPRVVVAIEGLDRADRARRGTLLCGPPEGQRFDWVVEKLAELGVAAIRPVHCRRAAWTSSSVRHERWTRLARGALQQSLGRFAMTVHPPATLESAVEEEAKASVSLFADIGGVPVRQLNLPVAGDVAYVVGPAEGLTDEEKTFLGARGFRAISLSENRLRTETAAIAWAAWWSGSCTSQD